MSFRIGDGKGRGYTTEVNSENQLVTRAINSPEIEHASGVLGTAFSWDSGLVSIDAGDTALFVKNLGTVPLIIDRITLNCGSGTDTFFNIGIGADSTTPAGTQVTPVNMNEIFSTKQADAIAYADETAIPDAPVLDRCYSKTLTSVVTDGAGIILGQNHYIQINNEVASTNASVIIIGHFEEVS